MTKLLKRVGVTVAATLLIVVIAVPAAFQLLGKVELPTAGKGAFKLPQGKQIYAIAQAAEVWPKLTEAKIDPVDVHVGDTQTIEVVVESRAAVDEVVAYIQTDNGVVTLPLERVNDPGSISIPRKGVFDLISYQQPLVPVAHAEGTTVGRYRGSWVVYDTHDTTYTTRIVARAGEDESEVVLAWSDACSIPMGGSFTLSTPCTISSPDGIDNGSFTVNSSLTLDADFAFNSGQSLTIGSGSIAVCSNCQLLQTNIFLIDADNDTYPASFTQYLQTSAPTNGKRRYTLVSTVDCDDQNATRTTNCATTCYKDVDGDTYRSSSPTSSCTGGDPTTPGPDCMDTNANVHPGQTNYFTTHRGDESFDYNCDGIEEALYQNPFTGGPYACYYRPSLDCWNNAPNFETWYCAEPNGTCSTIGNGYPACSVQYIISSGGPGGECEGDGSGNCWNKNIPTSTQSCV